MHFYLRYQEQSRKSSLVNCRSGVVGFITCIAMSSAGFAKPREVVVTDSYDGVQYHFAKKIAKAVARDKRSNLFRIVVNNHGPSGWDVASALYNRKQKTFKIHAYSDWLMPNDDLDKVSDLAKRVHSTVGWLYRNVTDAKLRKLAGVRTESYLLLFGGNDSHLTKLGIKGRQLYERKSYWDVQSNGRETPARWIFDEATATYRYPKEKLKIKRTFP